MKKILVSLIILALASPAFAQTWNNTTNKPTNKPILNTTVNKNIYNIFNPPSFNTSLFKRGRKSK